VWCRNLQAALKEFSIYSQTAVGQQIHHFYEFDRIRLDAGKGRLLRGDEVVPLTQIGQR